MSAGVVFFGYTPLAVTGLSALAAAGARLLALVVPANRSGHDVEVARAAAAQRDLPILTQPPALDVGPFAQALRALAPDLLVVCGYSMILPPPVLAVPRLGAVNVHGGPLPEFRGGHVLQWALLTGAPEFGVTLHHMDAGVDTGPVIAEHRFPLTGDDDARTVRARIRDAATGLLAAWWPRLADGSAPRVPQDERRAKRWPMRTEDEGRLDWRMDGTTVTRHVRALCANMPGAFIDVGPRRLMLRRVAARPASGAAVPGQLVHVASDHVRVALGDAELEILEADIDGVPASAAEISDLLRAHG